MRSAMVCCVGYIVLIVLVIRHPVAMAGVSLAAVQVASGLTQPLFLTAPPGDTSRLFIVERGGTIKIVKNGQLLPVPFLDVSDRISLRHSEQGLLGLAFHPYYSSNLAFFITYTDTSGATALARYFRHPTNPDQAVAASAKLLLVQPQPAECHNGGMVA